VKSPKGKANVKPVSRRIKLTISLETPRVIATIRVPTRLLGISRSEAGALLDRLNTSAVKQVSNITKKRRAAQKAAA